MGRTKKLLDLDGEIESMNVEEYLRSSGDTRYNLTPTIEDLDALFTLDEDDDDDRMPDER